MVLRKVAPIPTSFMVISIIGFLLSAVYLVQYSLTWGVTFSLVFMCMFIASMISMERANPDAQLSAIPSAKIQKVREPEGVKHPK